MRIGWFGLCAALYLLVQLPSAALAADRPDGKPLAGLPFSEFHTRDKLGRDIRYYLSPGEPGAPLLLLIQGSGCLPAFIDDGRGNWGSTVYGALRIANRKTYTVLVVDKPFANKSPGAWSGTTTDCGSDFNREFTAERWLIALQAAMSAAQTDSPGPVRHIVFGMSEGAVMASMVAAEDDQVTDVVAMGATGPTQLFDFIAVIYRGPSDQRDKELGDLATQVRAINAIPDSISDFAWGHPYRRWSSFLKISPAENLMRSRARVYLLSGEADESVPILSTEVIYATLLAKDRDVTLRRVAGADHFLQTPGGDPNQTGVEFDRALDWIAAPPRR